MQEINEPGIFNDVEPVEDSLVDEKLLKNNEENLIEERIYPGNLGWDKHVMSFLDKSERDGKNPKYKGLRRIVNILVGPITGSSMKVVQEPNFENGQRATVEWTYTVLNIHNLVDGQAPYEQSFTDAADAFPGNTSNAETFAIYPVAIASTRAQVRALRQILSLSVAGADEISDKTLDDAMALDNRQKKSFEDDETPGPMSGGQANKIDMFCERLGLHPMRYLQWKNPRYKNLRQVSYTSAINFIKELSEMVREPDSQLNSEVPETVKGFDPEWRDK